MSKIDLSAVYKLFLVAARSLQDTTAQPHAYQNDESFFVYKGTKYVLPPGVRESLAKETTKVICDFLLNTMKE